VPELIANNLLPIFEIQFQVATSLFDLPVYALTRLVQLNKPCVVVSSLGLISAGGVLPACDAMLGDIERCAAGAGAGLYGAHAFSVVSVSVVAVVRACCGRGVVWLCDLMSRLRALHLVFFTLCGAPASGLERSSVYLPRYQHFSVRFNICGSLRGCFSG
jgi:hypothetical protein